MESQGFVPPQEDQKPHIQTRAETSRSLEDAEKYKALDTLAELGLLIPLREVEVFHGRVGTEGEQWQVDTHLSNAGNDTGNNNVNKRPSLYTSTPEIATDFATEREWDVRHGTYWKIFQDQVRNYTPQQKQDWLKRLNDERKNAPEIKEDSLSYHSTIRNEAVKLEKKLSEEERKLLQDRIRKKFQAEIHQIVLDDPDASAINLKFNHEKLTDENKQRYEKALAALLLPITEGAPVDFDSRTQVEPVMEEIMAQKKNLISSDEVNEIAQKTGVDAQVVLRLASAYNSRRMAAFKPKYLAYQLLGRPEDIITDTFDMDGQKQEIPINLEYAQRYFRAAHIVAAKQSMNSITLNRDSVPTFSFFDLEKVGTRDQLEEKKREMEEKMGGLLPHLPDLLKSEASGPTQELLLLLDDAYAKPEKIIEAAKKINGYEEIFDKDIGVKEGFTLGEHTETVLRNFDENFADVIPVEYLPLLRLTLLAHDLGKPKAVEQGEKENQQEYNQIAAREFLNTIGVGEKIIDLVTAIITDGSRLVFALQKNSEKQPLETMRSFAQETLKHYLGSAEVSEAQIRAFIGMCKIVQLCDGGAYTSMAITRREGKGRFRNKASFNDSFAPPIGPGKRDIKYRLD